MGTTGGIMNFARDAMAVVAPIATATGSFEGDPGSRDDFARAIALAGPADARPLG
jgi:hypothetical protein